MQPGGWAPALEQLEKRAGNSLQMGLKETDADCSDRHTHGERPESPKERKPGLWTEKPTRCWHGTHFRYGHTESLKAKVKIKHPDTTDKETEWAALIWDERDLFPQKE